MATPRPIDYALLTGIGLSWGSQFVFNRLAIDSMPPLMVATGRVVIGCGALTVFLWIFPKYCRTASGQAAKQPWAMYAIIGITEAILPCFLVPWGQQHVNASVAAILMATIPIFTLLLAPIFAKGESFSFVTALGVILGFCGVLVLFVPHPETRVSGNRVGELAILAAALSFATSLILMKRLPSVPPILAIRNIFLTAALPLVIATVFWHQPWRLSITTKSVFALVALGIICGAVAYVMYISLLIRTGPTFTSLCNYLVTLVGVLIGVIFLGNAVRIHDIGAMALILSTLSIHQLRRG